MSHSPEAEQLKTNLLAKGVKYAMASYVDIHGVIKGKFVPLVRISAHRDHPFRYIVTDHFANA